VLEQDTVSRPAAEVRGTHRRMEATFAPTGRAGLADGDSSG